MCEQKESVKRSAGRHTARNAYNIGIQNPSVKESAVPRQTGRHTAAGKKAAHGPSSAANKRGKVVREDRKRRKHGKLSVASDAGSLKSPKMKARRSEARNIVRRSLIAAVVLIAALGVLTIFRPQINLARAHRYIESGRIDKAEELLNYMLRESYEESGIADVRLDLGNYFLREGDYARVYAILTELPDDERSRDLYLQAQYGEANSLLENGELDRGAQQLYRLGDYSDSAERYDDARTAIAMRNYLAGDEASAWRMFNAVDDAGAHVSAAARLVTDDEEEARHIAAMEVFSTENINRVRESYRVLSAAREETNGARIAAGEHHTVGLKDDGSVLAAGNNNKGQCDVSEWSDIIEVAAGARHTAGLKLDGTVVATGDNSFGQCDVGSWTGIVAIAANSYSTLGLKSDGTVIATRLIQDKVSGWHDVCWISGGAYSAGCLYGQGSMLCSHKGAQLDMTVSLKRLSVCGAVSAGVGEDNQLVSSYDKAPAWSGLVDIAVTQTGLLGVTQDGKALNYFFRTAVQQEWVIEGSAVEIAGSGTHAVILTDAGRVFAFGSNDSGQCDVSDWLL